MIRNEQEDWLNMGDKLAGYPNHKIEEDAPDKVPTTISPGKIKRPLPQCNTEVNTVINWICDKCGVVYEDAGLGDIRMHNCNSSHEYLNRYDQRKKQLRETLENKGNDYSGSEDRHANFKVFHYMTQGRPVIVTPLISCLIRQLDKIQRAINLHINGRAYVEGETMKDTLRDNSGYADIAEDIWELTENEDNS